MDEQTVKLAELAKKYNCTEALFVTGERPEQKYQEAKKWLRKQVFHPHRVFDSLFRDCFETREFFHIRMQGILQKMR